MINFKYWFATFFLLAGSVTHSVECTLGGLPKTLSDFSNHFAEPCKIGDYTYELKDVDYLGSISALNSASCTTENVSLNLEVSNGPAAKLFRVCSLDNKMETLENAFQERGLTLFSSSHELVKIDVKDPSVWIK